MANQRSRGGVGSFWGSAWRRLWTENGWSSRPSQEPASSDQSESAKKGSAAPKRTLSLSLEGATATLEDQCGGDDGKSGDDGAGKGGGTLGATVLKAVAWVATGVTATGFVVVVGAALFWIRFNEVGLPATQAVGLLARNELLVQGAQVTIIDVAIALVAVLLVFFVDPAGKVVRVSLLLLVLLTLLGILYVHGTHLHGLTKLALSLLAVLLLAGVVVVGLRTDDKFWPLALGVFVATLLYSAAVGLLVVDQQSYVQAVAVLRSNTDAGLTGVYVTANSKDLYLGRLSQIALDKERNTDRRALFDVPISGATYAVGPLESVESAETRGQVMLEQLLQQRERDPGGTSVAPKAAAAPKSTDEASGPTGAQPAPTNTTSETVETVAAAFGTAVTVRHAVAGDWTCLVRYGAAGSSMLGHWWTSCRGNDQLKGKSILGIRDTLALPGRFQPAFDMKVVAHLPAEAPILYLEGEIGPQCAHEKPTTCGYEFPGGGTQIYLPRPEKVEDPVAECTDSREDEVPRWGPCGTGAG